jgi:hypothetical protein
VPEQEAAVAEIDVVPRKSRTWMWWLLAIVIVAIALIVLTRPADDTRDAPVGSGSSRTTPSALHMT